MNYITDNSDILTGQLCGYETTSKIDKTIENIMAIKDDEGLDASNNVLNKIYIDIAVLCQEYTHIGVMCDNHITNLDEIPIPINVFQSIFYPYKDNFGLNKDFLNNNKQLLPYISFSSEFRNVDGKKFYLLEQIISNIETDLSVSRSCFTKESLVELSNEMTNIRTLLDIKCCSLLSSLTWPNVMDIINNYTDINCGEVIPILIVNVVFKTPTECVKDTIIRFQYKLT
jgi:hypothetical protein